MNTDKLYQDWLNGTEFNFAATAYENGGELPPEINELAKRISESKQQAFDWAVELELTKLKNDISLTLKKADPTTRLELEIQIVESYINNNPELLRRCMDGERDHAHINGSRYQQIRQLWEKFKTEGCHIGITVQHDGKGIPSDLHRMHVQSRYLESLRAEYRRLKHGETFPSADTRQWFDRLKTDPAYQKGNGEPHLTHIFEEIVELHYQKIGIRPTSDAIRKQYYNFK